MIRKDIATLLKNRRKELNLSLEEAGKRIGISKTTYRDYENGVLLVDNMKIEKLVPLALYLDIYPNNLFEIGFTSDSTTFTKFQFKELMTKAINNVVEDLTEDEKQYLIKSFELICK